MPNEDLIDPDPMEVLTYITASLTSVYSFGLFMESRHRLEYKLSIGERALEHQTLLTNLLLDVEVELIALEGILVPLKELIIESGNHRMRLENLPFRFGGCKLNLSKTALVIYQKQIVAAYDKSGQILHLNAQIREHLSRLSISHSEETREQMNQVCAWLNNIWMETQNYDEAFQLFHQAIRCAQNFYRSVQALVKPTSL